MTAPIKFRLLVHCLMVAVIQIEMISSPCNAQITLVPTAHVLRISGEASSSLLEDYYQLGKGVAERAGIIANATNSLVPYSMYGSASACVAALKSSILGMSGAFLNKSVASGGNFDNWLAQTNAAGQYPSTLPGWSLTGLLTYASLPTNFSTCTPWSGNSIAVLSSATFGVTACGYAITPLDWIGLTSLSMTNYFEAIDKYDSQYHLRVVTDTRLVYCNQDVETNYDILDVGSFALSPCGLGLPPVTTSFTAAGMAEWFIEGIAQYEKYTTQRSDDYECHVCGDPIVRTWTDNSSVLDESGSIDVTNLNVASSDVYVTAPPLAQGSVSTYGKFLFNPISATSGAVSVQSHCVPRYCTNDILDENEQVVSQEVVVCGVDIVWSNFTYTLPAWSPSSTFPTNWHEGGNAFSKTIGSGQAVGSIPEVEDINLPTEAITTKSQDYTCVDAADEDEVFGLSCIGPRVLTTVSIECTKVIPPRRLYYQSGFAVLKLELEYP